MITAEQVKSELNNLIDLHPNNSGSISIREDGGDGECVYYLDADGVPVDFGRFSEEDEEEPINNILVTPICIVGHWVEKFHPELKEDVVIKRALLKNSTVTSLYDCGNMTSLNTDVLHVLSDYQCAQDSTNTKTWSDIHDYMAVDHY